MKNKTIGTKRTAAYLKIATKENEIGIRNTNPFVPKINFISFLECCYLDIECLYCILFHFMSVCKHSVGTMFQDMIVKTANSTCKTTYLGNIVKVLHDRIFPNGIFTVLQMQIYHEALFNVLQVVGNRKGLFYNMILHDTDI